MLRWGKELEREKQKKLCHPQHEKPTLAKIARVGSNALRRANVLNMLIDIDGITVRVHNHKTRGACCALIRFAHELYSLFPQLAL